MALALGYMLKRAAVSSWRTQKSSLLAFGRISATVDNINDNLGNGRASNWGVRNYCPCCSTEPLPVNLSVDIYDPFVFTLPTFGKYYDQLKATLGFGIDVDLGDYPGIIRPYPGSLDDPEVTTPARFAIDQHNKSKNENIQFLKVVKANRQGDKYFLIFDGVDNARKMKRYKALVDGSRANKMELKRFDLYGDSDEPLQPYVIEVVHRYKDSFCILAGPNVPFDPETMVREERVHPKDYFKYLEQVAASQGFDVDENLDLGYSIGNIFPLEGSMDDPRITAPAEYAVKECNRRQKTQLQLVRVLKGTHLKMISMGFIYNLTCEVDDAGEKKIFQTRVHVREERRIKVTLIRIIGENGDAVTLYKASIQEILSED